MVKAYLEDSSVSEDGALSRFGDFLGKMGKGLSSAALVAAPLLVLAGIGLAVPIGGTALLAGSVLGGTGIAAGGLALTGLKILTGLVVAGGAFKAADSLKSGQPRKATKEILKSVSQGAALFGAVTLLGPLGLLGAAALEVGSLVFTQKSLLTHTGDISGALLDSVIGNDKPKGYNVNIPQPNVTMAGMSPAVQMTPQMQPQMGQMPAGVAGGYNSVPASVGYTSDMAQLQPQSTQWRDQISSEQGRGQQQAPVRLSSAEQAHWGDKVELAHTAAHLIG